MEQKIDFHLKDTEESVSFYVIEQTKISNRNYLLVTESMEEAAEAYIMKDVSGPEDEEALYQMVEDEEEIKLVGSIFRELLADDDIELS